MSNDLNHNYSETEEKLNIWTHGFGFVACLVAFPFLIIKATNYSGFWQPASFIMYGLSLLLLYAASTLYHSAKNPHKRRRLNIFDHAAIYVLIAGSYSPFCLVALTSKAGWYLFIFVWIFALIGVVLKLFFTGKYDKISTLMYLLMGWLALFIGKPLLIVLTSLELNLLLAGGVFYTIGAILYSMKKMPYNHATFHVFVLLGSFSHFFAIYLL